MRRPTLYVPAPGSPLEEQLERGCAIVGVRGVRAGGRVEVEIESRRFQEPLSVTFADRVERCLERWRASAGSRRRTLAAVDLVAVAACTLRSGLLVLDYDDDPDLLAGWIGDDWLGDGELRTTRSVVTELSAGVAAPASPTPAPAAARPRSGRANTWHTL
jgi:hypothetical protein